MHELAASGRAAAGVGSLGRAIDDYLTYLRVERGLAERSIAAYRGDLSTFARSKGVDRLWSRSSDPAVRYLADLATRRAPSGSVLRTTTRRRRTASLRGFYRFAFGEGLIDIDVASHIDLPRQGRHLPEVLSVGEVERMLESIGPTELTLGQGAGNPRLDARAAASAAGLRDRALLELLYASGLRISEALGLDREDLSLEGGFVRVIGKGDKERMVPVGEVRPLRQRSEASLAGAKHRHPSRRSVLRDAPRPPPGATAGLDDRQARRAHGRPRCSGDAAHSASLVRDPSPGGRSRPAHRPGVARTCEYQHHAALHAPDRRTRT